METNPLPTPATEPEITVSADILQELEEGEEPIPLGELSKRSFVPKRDGKAPHISLWFRWASKGLRGIKLETIVAGRLCTTRSAVLRFYARLTNASTASTPAATPTRAFRRRQAQVDRALDEAGIK